MKTVIIDNYDSFTYNLNHLIKELGSEVCVLRNDRFQLTDLTPFDKIILSPGLGIPQEAGLLLDVIRRYGGVKPMLGICLGEQAIGEAFGARLINLKTVYHGVQTPVKLLNENEGLFRNLPPEVMVGRYHSWVVDKLDFPDCLSITAVSDEGFIMGLRHTTYNIHGIQFHPESVLTPMGKDIIKNFLYQ